MNVKDTLDWYSNSGGLGSGDEREGGVGDDDSSSGDLGSAEPNEGSGRLVHKRWRQR